MKVKIEIIAEIDQDALDNNLENGLTTNGILNELYMQLELKRNNLIHDAEVNSVIEVK